MTIRFSPALQNFIAAKGSWKNFMDNGSLEVYTGTMPATPNLAVTGTLLATFTSAGLTKTDEVCSQGTLTLTGTSGSVNTLTVNGLEVMGSLTAFNTSLTQTAADIALKCNRNPKNYLYHVTSSGAVITFTALPGLGAMPNGWAVAATYTATLSGTAANMGSGGAATAGANAANGLLIDYNPVAGAVTKDAGQTWSATVVGAGTQTAGWFRYKGSVADAGALDSSAVFLRMDGDIATSGAALNMFSTSLTNGQVRTLDTFSITVPAA